MVYTFITEKTDPSGVRLAGKKIQAESWDEAEKKAQSLGLEVLGILHEERTIYNYV